MYYIISTSPGYLALANSETDKLVLLAGKAVCALPEPAFWAHLRKPQPKHAPSLYAEMVSTPIGAARMARVEGDVGVWPLLQEKQILNRAGLTRANAHTQAPIAAEVDAE